MITLPKLSSILFCLGSFIVLSGCESGHEAWTVGSRESTETLEKRLWYPDKSTVAGLQKNKLSQTITPRIGFNMPIDEPSKEILKTRETSDAKTMNSVKTQRDVKNKSIKIIADQN